MLELFSECAKSKGLGSNHRFVSCRTVGKRPRKLWNFSYPTIVFLAFAFNTEVHGDHLDRKMGIV